MRRLIVVLICCVELMWPDLYAQSGEYIDDVIEYLGTEEGEELISKPLALNQADRMELLASGLFTSYQTASIIDYRTRHGDILSFTELSYVDGFDRRKVALLQQFIILNSSDCPGRREIPDNLRNKLQMRGAVRMNAPSDIDWNYGTRYLLETDSFSVTVSFSNSYDYSEAYPSAISGNAVYKYSNGKIVLGDFNARFGQGLCLWNTMTLGGYTSPSAFMRRPSGLSPTFSFTGSSALTGVCADYNFRKWIVSTLLALPEIKSLKKVTDMVTFLPALNLTRYGSNGHFSFTQLCQPGDMKTSLDVALCFNGVNLYGEAVMTWMRMMPAATLGLDFPVTDYLRLASLIRYLPMSGVYGAAVSGEYVGKVLTGQFSADYEYYTESKAKDASLSMQLKMQTSWVWNLTENLALKFRISERLRSWGNPLKTQLRADVSYSGEFWFGCMRMDFLKYEDYAIAGYVESGYKWKYVSVFLRQGLFRIDDWDDRIYIYERDAPGNYTVPAFYGRGLWTSTYVSLKPTGNLSLYLRASYITYPFMEAQKKKPDRVELKLQCALRF